MANNDTLVYAYAFTDLVLDNINLNVDNTDKIKNVFLRGISNDEEALARIMNRIINIKLALDDDLDFFLAGDPAAKSKDEIRLTYPGYKAISYYRVAHELANEGYNLIARAITEKAHSLTGIDIHPNAQIGVPFFIDHGTGVVIGETTIIGKNVKMYQGVTLGALSLSKGSLLKGQKRHPTVGDNVTLYSGASILGDIKIGDNVTVGSNVFITEDIPSDCKVILQKPELVVLKKEGFQNGNL